MFGARAVARRQNKQAEKAIRSADLKTMIRTAVEDYAEATRTHRKLVKENGASDDYMIHRAEYPVSFKLSDENKSYIRFEFFAAVEESGKECICGGMYYTVPVHSSLSATNLKRGKQNYVSLEIVVSRELIWQ